MANFELIKPSVERIDEKDNLKRIELAGRVCYKSEDKITEDSAKAFCDKIRKRGHTSVMEHSNIIVRMPWDKAVAIIDAMAVYGDITGGHSHIMSDTYRCSCDWYFSGNMRAWLDLFDAVEDYNEQTTGDPLPISCMEDIAQYEIREDQLPEPLRKRHTRITLRITCDRGVSHEIVRHRVMSFSQESTRYVNYGKRGFVFVAPWWWDSGDNRRNEILLGSMDYSAKAYEALIADGASPQLARAVLPNMIKTEVVVTATPEQWEAFLRLRLSKAAHPDMQRVARLVLEALGDDVEVQDENH